MSPTTKRLTRSASDSVKAQEFASRQRESQSVGLQYTSGVGRELGALRSDGVVPEETGLRSTRAANQRDGLRGGKKDKDPLAPKAARVTKSRGTTGRKKKGGKKVYLGPGYRREGGAVEGEERECLICAEVLSG